MKQILALMLIVFLSCTGQQTAEQHEHVAAGSKEDKTPAIPLNNGAKWKADEATKKNVAALAEVINDSSYAQAGQRKALYTKLEANINTLVKECSMKGEEHDALHVWLEKVLKDMKELKEDNGDYNVTYAALQQSITRYYESFE